MTDTQKLIADYVEAGSETAFRELVTRYVDLVYSAAVRLVNGDTHLAEDVTQTVFADLARQARKMPGEVMLGGWLHRHTCFVAANTMRGERRRRDRERQAMEMNITEDHSAANLALVAPALDEAINELGAEDRAAIMLRFFEQHDFRSVGEAMGSNEEAARKRVDRALDKLHALLTRRGVTLSATALGATLATQVVTAAPAGLGISISSAALAGAATGKTALTILQIMSITKLKVGIISAVVVAGVAIPLVLQQRTQKHLTESQDALRQQVQRANQELAAENEALLKQVARASTPPPASNSPSLELLRLRGEVGRLRQENASVLASKTNAPSAISGLKANPEMWKMIRDQQKLGMSMIYKELGTRLKLTKEQTGKLNELLADSVMDNIDHITAILGDKKAPAEAEALLAAQEALVNEKVKELLGEEGYTEYHDYNKNLASYITAEQFKEMMTGEKTEKDAKAKQFYKLLQEETQQTLASAGLSPDYQLVPTLNFRNFTSEATAEKNLSLLDGIYERVTAKAGTLLSEEEITKFGEFRGIAIKQNRMGLAVNRQLMGPTTK